MQVLSDLSCIFFSGQSVVEEWPFWQRGLLLRAEAFAAPYYTEWRKLTQRDAKGRRSGPSGHHDAPHNAEENSKRQ